MYPNRKIFEILSSLGTLEEMERLAGTGFGLDAGWKFNTHIHLPPNFSAFQSVPQALDLAASQNIRVLGTSNYYDFGIYQEFADGGSTRGIFPLFGLEIIAIVEELQQARILVNDPGNPGRMYLCGKGVFDFSPMNLAASGLMGRVRRNDEARMIEMIERLERVFAGAGCATGLNEDRILERIIHKYQVPRETVGLQERHIAQAFQEALFEQSAPSDRPELLRQILGVPSRCAPDDSLRVQNEIRSHLMKVGKPAYVPEEFLGLDQAYRLILQLGGIPCYPTLADGASPICPYEDPVDKLVGQLKSREIHCAEFIPIRNKPEVLQHYVRTMRMAGIVVTCGTEHNTPDLIPLEPSCIAGAPIVDDVQEIFREGACVVAAHQYLGFHEKQGYVDRNGRLNSSFGGREERIEYFHRLGAAVIARYHEACFR